MLYDEPTLKLNAQDGAYLLEIRLPLVEAEDFTASRYGDQLVIQIQNQRRNYLLPRFLTYYALVESRIEDGWLRVRFASDET